ncbi:MAG TPA: PEP-CTERM sorting domain-containing protein [Vicinamibacterales bacterium]
MRTWVAFCLFVCVLAAASTAAAGPITINFNLGTGQQYGPLTNGSCPTTASNNCSPSPFTESSGGVNLSATAWSITDVGGVESGDFSGAELGSYSIGLGVCDAAEGGPNCDSPNHQIDNFGGKDDFVLINFGTQVSLSSIQLFTYDDSDGDGRNISYWVGNTIPNGNLASDSVSNFTFTNVTCPGTCTNPATDPLTGTGQYLLIGASLIDNPGTCGRRETCAADEFKIQDVTLTPGDPDPVPEPTSMVLLGTGLLAGASRLRRQRRLK